MGVRVGFGKRFQSGEEAIFAKSLRPDGMWCGRGEGAQAGQDD